MPNKQQRILLFGALAATLATAGVLIFHTVRHATQVIRTVKHARHTPEGEALRPWMTIPYIAATHHVPPKVLYDAIARARGHEPPHPEGSPP